jgi:hypothetical protein
VALLTHGERRALTEAVLSFLAANKTLTAQHLASWFGCARGQVHSVLLTLRARGLVEVVDVLGDESRGPGLEYVWRLTEHAFHDPRQVLPGTPRCTRCRRRASAG